MAFKLLFGVKSTPGKMSIIELDNIHLDDKVEKLRIEIAAHFSSNDSFDFLYCGNYLDDDDMLEYYNLKNKSLIYVLKKPNVNKVKAEDPLTSNSDTKVQKVVSAFKSFVGKPIFESALRRLMERPEVIVTHIVKLFPDLQQDAVAISLLQDPDLLIHLTNKETVQRVSQQHPALMDASLHVAKAVSEEVRAYAIRCSSKFNAATSGQSFSVDDISGDEDMSETVERMGRRIRIGINNNSPRNNNVGRRGVATFEMLNQVAQQVFARGLRNQSSVALPPIIAENNMQENLLIMREMGLMNDDINRQALQFTNGNVDVAIDLVFSGFEDTT